MSSIKKKYKMINNFRNYAKKHFKIKMTLKY